METYKKRFVDFIKGMEDSWNAYDHRGWASAFAEEVEFINIFGGYHRGRDDIDLSHKHLYQGVFKDSDQNLTVEMVKPVPPGIYPDLFQAVIFTHLVHKKGVYDGRMMMLVRDLGDTFEILQFQNTFVNQPGHHGNEPVTVEGAPSYRMTPMVVD